jgi:hypothetical protein
MWKVLLTLVLIVGSILLLQIVEPMTDIPVPRGRFLPQVNALGRSIDEKVAMDQKEGAAYAPADFNTLFESFNF